MPAVENVTKNRTRLLQESKPHLVFENDYMETEVGTRGLIRIMDSKGNLLGLEFIEPEEFWADPDAVEEYLETMEDGLNVTVIVPGEERSDAEELLHEEVGKAVVVLGYDDIGKPLGFSV